MDNLNKLFDETFFELRIIKKKDFEKHYVNHPICKYYDLYIRYLINQLQKEKDILTPYFSSLSSLVSGKGTSG